MLNSVLVNGRPSAKLATCFSALCYALVCVLGVSSVAKADAETVQLALGNVTLLGDMVTADDSQATVLLVHGTLAHKDMELMEALQTGLADRNLSSLAITLSLSVDRREGMYDCATPHKHQMGDAVAEIDAWVRWLEANAKGPLAVLGHSRGGAQVAWYLADKQPQSIMAAVLMAPAYEKPLSSAAEGYQARFKADLGSVVEKAKRSKDALMDVPGILYCPDTKATGASILSYYAADDRRDSPTMAEKASVPLLVVAAAKDNVVPEVAARFAPLSKAGKASVQTVEDADHMFLDFYADDAADLISEFLSSVGS